MYIRIVLGFVPTFFTSKYSFSSGVGYVMRPILLIIWTAFQSFILREKVFKKGLYFSVLSALPFFKKVWIKNKNPKIIYIYIYT